MCVCVGANRNLQLCSGVVKQRLGNTGTAGGPGSAALPGPEAGARSVAPPVPVGLGHRSPAGITAEKTP